MKPFVSSTLYRWDHSLVATGIDLVDALRQARRASDAGGGVFVVVRDSDFAALGVVSPEGKRHPDGMALRAWVGRMKVILAGDIAA